MKKQESMGLTKVFWISTILVGVFVVYGSLKPDQLSHYANIFFDFTANYFGGVYLISTVFFIGFCLFIAFSRYGTIKLGQDSDQPRFSYFNWIGMLFSAGFGVSLVFWGVSEPITHYMEPPPGITPETNQAANKAIQYAMFHWGIHQWSVFAVIGLIIGYFKFRKQENALISKTLEPLFKSESMKKKQGWKTVIDSLAVIATATGVATSLGLGILQIDGGLSFLFNFPGGTVSQIAIMLILLTFYLISSLTGLNRGIRILSLVNLSVALLLMAFSFLTGPSKFIIDTFVSGVGSYLQNFFQMSFNINPLDETNWINQWTLFYWAWAIAWSPFVGTFIARVSQGRTIREFILGVLFVPALVAMVWMAVLGGSAIYFEIIQGAPIMDAVQKDLTNALFVTLQQFPLGSILIGIAITLIFTFLITSADSATFVLAMMTSGGRLNPSKFTKILWGFLQAGIAVVLLISSGLQGLQTASLITALPFAIIMIAMCFSFYKQLKNEFK
ncbi:glycine/betaine ABC transporter permease [Paraliobacillus quinghaiensis]|uniref:Glycine/betaine ABC transporter permease n=1 Tax=Paraliobacillus quinghaiensis TaxID=470815 RepID=A0A917TVA1_9BACI|nr:BCCT family transporter [Paraliobacillus quinghaiensis]GGM37480.1 glycine/betaine ABC transporter permease [Paraliobacillus quinghaiensis]